MNVKKIREKTGLSQSKFCEKFGLNKRTFMDWESGRKKPAEAARTLLLVIDQYPAQVSRVVWGEYSYGHPNKTTKPAPSEIESQSDVRKRLNSIFTNHLGIPHPEKYGPEADIWNDLGADSLDVVEMIMSAEEEFEIEITEPETADIRTIGDIEKLVIKKTT